ncbi:hypothetical protein GTY65_36625 [Streptomyces sp. SID8379]|uniref:hypothetical protein n=1 Tax=unclassified Streptomyces TaxID=2593676 RepID=UPI00036C4931|nr:MULTISPECIES: hypothetical protein [unclassified Streptomyces]MYW69553.1 hypothetical protein [Streptomyces sp. SID8379]
MTSPPQTRPKKSLGQLHPLGYALLLGFVVMTAVFGFQTFSNFGQFGKQGTFAVKDCERSYSHNSTSHRRRSKSDVRASCGGTFRSDDGSYVDKEARVTIGSGDAPSDDGKAYVARLIDADVSGLRLHAQRYDGGFLAAFNGDYDLVNRERALKSAGMASGGLISLGLGIFCMAGDWPRVGAPTLKETWRGVMGAPSRIAVLLFLGLGLLGLVGFSAAA